MRPILLGHFGHREPLEVVQLHDPPLVLRQTGEGLGEPQQLLAADGPLARRGLVGREQALQPGRGALQLGLQGSLPPGVARLGLEPPGRRRQGVRQDGAEPGQPLAFGPAPELVPPLVGLQDRLLDDVGGVELRAQAGAHLEPDEQQEVIAVVLDRADVVASVWSHRSAPSLPSISCSASHVVPYFRVRQRRPPPIDPRREGSRRFPNPILVARSRQTRRTQNPVG